MKEFTPNLRVVAAAAAFLDAVFILAATLFFDGVNVKMLLGLLLGSVYAVCNHLALAYTVKRLANRTKGRAELLYNVSYLLRLLMAAGVLAVGFAYLNPFAVFVPMLAPKVGYYFMGFSGKEIK